MDKITTNEMLEALKSENHNTIDSDWLYSSNASHARKKRIARSYLEIELAMED